MSLNTRLNKEDLKFARIALLGKEVDHERCIGVTNYMFDGHMITVYDTGNGANVSIRGENEEGFFGIIKDMINREREAENPNILRVPISFRKEELMFWKEFVRTNTYKFVQVPDREAIEHDSGVLGVHSICFSSTYIDVRIRCGIENCEEDELRLASKVRQYYRSIVTKERRSVDA